MIKKISIGVIALVAIALLYFRLFGYENYVVVSDSMYPYIPKHSVVFIKTKDYDSLDGLKVGDVIAIESSGQAPFMHRIYEFKNDEIITKGDANDEVDKPIKPNRVLGKLVFSIPFIGLIFYNIYFWLIIVCLILIYYISILLIKEVKKSKETN